MSLQLALGGSVLDRGHCLPTPGGREARLHLQCRQLTHPTARPGSLLLLESPTFQDCPHPPPHTSQHKMPPAPLASQSLPGGKPHPTIQLFVHTFHSCTTTTSQRQKVSWAPHPASRDALPTAGTQHCAMEPLRALRLEHPPWAPRGRAECLGRTQKARSDPVSLGAQPLTCFRHCSRTRKSRE